jgi:kumamolisin
VPAGYHVLGDLGDNSPVSLRVTLEPRNRSELAAFITATSTPGNLLFQSFLSPDEFADRFGPSRDTQRNVLSFFQSHGVRAEFVGDSSMVLVARGTARSVASVLHTHFVAVRDGSQRGYLTTSASYLPREIASVIAGVSGLSSLPRAHSNVQPAPRPALAAPTACSSASTAASARNAYLPAAIASAYGIDTALANGYNGSGRSVAIVSFADYYANDISTYWSCFGLSNSVIDVPVSGGPASSTAATDGAEVALDIQQVASLAPGATIYNYAAPNDAFGFVDVFSAIADDHLADVVTVSWGMCETDAASQSLQPLFMQLAAQGQAVFVASGDSGASSCAYSAPSDDPSVDYSLTVDDPSNSPWVTGVGGVALTSISPLSQTVWSGSCGSTPCGSGGGASRVYPRPSWQVGPGVDLTLGRQVPDLSVMASPANGMLAYYKESWRAFGGTSIGAPLMAALVTVGAQVCSVQRFGFLNPRLYQMGIAGSGFNDVTTGSNDIYSMGGYSATPNYDMASGLGTPDPSEFLSSLCAQNQSVTSTSYSTGAAAKWTFHYVSSGADLVGGRDVIRVTGFTNGGLPTSPSSYLINGAHPTNVVLSGLTATLALPVTIAARSNVVLEVSGAINALAAYTRMVRISDSNDFSVYFPLTFTPSVIASVSLSGGGSLAAGSNGTNVVATVTDSTGATLSGVAVSVSESGDAISEGTNYGVTNFSGQATFRIVDATAETVRVTASAGGVTSAPVVVQFTLSWQQTPATLRSAIGALTGQPVSSTACGVVIRTSRGGIVFTSSNIAAALATQSTIKTPLAASDIDATNGANGSCILAYISPTGQLTIVTVSQQAVSAATYDVKTKRAVVAPGIVVNGETITVVSLSTSGRVLVNQIRGSVVTTRDLTTTLKRPAQSALGLRLADSLALVNGEPTLGLREGTGLSLYTHQASGDQWTRYNVVALALFDNTGTAALVGNATIVGGDLPRVYARTKLGHLVEFVPGGDLDSYWTPVDVTETSKKCLLSGDITVTLATPYQVLSVSRGTVYIALRNGTVDHPWLAVGVRVTGATAVVGLPNGSIGVLAGTKLITLTT